MAIFEHGDCAGESCGDAKELSREFFGSGHSSAFQPAHTVIPSAARNLLFVATPGKSRFLGPACRRQADRPPE